MAKLSVLGLYRWDPSVMDPLTVPEGMDRAALVNTIIAETAELEVLWPEPETFKFMLSAWVRMNKPLWERAWNALQLEYNPLWNVDADIVELETRNLQGAENRTYKSNVTGETDTTRTPNLSEEMQNGIAGFNSTTYENREKTDTRTTGTERTQGEHSETKNDTDDTTTRDSGTIEHKTRRTGNIGVTTSQEMLRQELEIAKVSVYDIIADSFKDKFCIMLY